MGEPPPDDVGAAPFLQINNSILTGGAYNIFAARGNGTDASYVRRITELILYPSDDDVSSTCGRNGAARSFPRNGKVWNRFKKQC